MGPVSLRPTRGPLGAQGTPDRQRADHNRRHGTRYVFGAWYVHADRLRVRLRPRRRGSIRANHGRVTTSGLPRPAVEASLGSTHSKQLAVYVRHVRQRRDLATPRSPCRAIRRPRLSRSYGGRRDASRNEPFT